VVADYDEETVRIYKKSMEETKGGTIMVQWCKERWKR
jgi:hypothetical protein